MEAKLNELLVKFSALRDRISERDKLRSEVDLLSKQVEQSRTKLQRDFEHWMTLMLRQQQAASAVTAGAITEGSSASASSPARSALVCIVVALSMQQCMHHSCLSFSVQPVSDSCKALCEE